MSEFLHMGGYAAFVWSAYGLSAVSLVLLVMVSRSKAKAAQAQVDVMRKRRKGDN